MKSSVIISTYNGALKIATLLEALARQTDQGFELIVVVDGSTDNTLDILKSYESRFRAMKILNQDNQGRSRVRNTGARAASGDLFIFYDDDMQPAENSVERHVKFHQTHQAILGGNQIERWEQGKTDIQNYKAMLTEKWTIKFAEPLTQLNYENLFFTAANCSIPRETFFLLNGFDERLTDAEDYDLAVRMLDRNIPVYFDKDNEAVHKDEITTRSYINRLRLYGKAHKKLQEFHPDRRKQASSRSSPFKRFIYFLMARPYFVSLIDKGAFKFLFPKSIRFRFYDIVIQSLAIEFPEKAL